MALELGAPGEGIVACALRGVEPGAELDGLPWRAAAAVASAPPASRAAHPNGAVGIDHVVVVTPDFDRTAAALDTAGLGLRRVRDAGGFRQGSAGSAP